MIADTKTIFLFYHLLQPHLLIKNDDLIWSFHFLVERKGFLNDSLRNYGNTKVLTHIKF